ncbi:short subunit dehydrogenase [Saccharopolyspora erythraea NRRL 2338]|uniref:Uncharacterized protein n=1 Tax=Saccharopolyspora erythraea TaxID=1836 RepID=A0ABN1C7X8_SACER|nr:SDR family NAD(P)-dependent oxidoreductase [Saccharopolyspora erythraea]EQD83014.1 oxidoreductase [Saccharopolyspora erythraea D]PFG96176.1 short subunit dehydrogenase [Saccharopolyspora erythraea NRRL 2338]QRK92709.1 SDR family NAD(P)-dependent oxidoreductase [Saccharopolyspora erythraea]
MKTIVITGGTDGMGRALAQIFLERGDQVVIVGRDERKGRDFLDAATGIGVRERATFIAADLSLVGENQRLVERIATDFPAVDALVLCARHYRATRLETGEGREHGFALFYLSRFVLSHGLLGNLEKAESPVVVNFCGPGADFGEIRWDDLELARDYHGNTAMVQGGKLNDLLGVAFAAHHPGARTRYVLYGPGMVSTSFSGEYDAESAAHVAYAKANGRSVADGIAPAVALVDSPPAEPLSAFNADTPVSLAGRSFDRSDAMRLHALTSELLRR